MKKMLILISLFISTAASASSRDFENCKVVEVVIAGANNAHVRLDCNVSPRPACATSGTYFGFDKSTQEGEQYLSVVLTAFASDSNVSGYVDDVQCAIPQSNVALLEHIRMTK